MSNPGTWHESQPDKQVPWSEAMDAWSGAVQSELEKVASRYGASITYGELAEAIQRATGYRTRTQLGNWIGKVLDVVVRRTLAEDLPPLTALVVHKGTGGVGDGYYNRKHAQYTLTDDGERQRVAAEDRLACYRMYCDSVPTNAAPQMTQLFRARDAARSSVRKPERQEQSCPNCYIVVPLTGECDTCGWTSR